MAAEDLGGDREYGYPAGPGVRVAEVVLIALTAALLVTTGIVIPVTWAVLRAGGAAGPGPPPFPWLALVGALVCAAVLAAEIAALTRVVLLRRRGRVEVTRVGITVTDWRGNEQRLFWDEITQLRALRRPDIDLRLYPPALALRAADRRVAIENGIEGRDDLYSTIVARAGLQQLTQQRWALLWRRPGVD